VVFSCRVEFRYWIDLETLTLVRVWVWAGEAGDTRPQRMSGTLFEGGVIKRNSIVCRLWPIVR
jgi:hypothetical protein